MPSVVDITGMKFGPWTVIEPAQRPAGLRMQGAFWLCECDCVRKTREVLNGARLRAGRGAKGCYHCRKPFDPYLGTSTQLVYAEIQPPEEPALKESPTS